MVRDIRITQTRRHAYRTKSNVVKPVKTPGGRLVAHYHKKKGSVPKCGDCKLPMKGLKAVRPKDMMKLKKREKTVSRVYGGSRCGKCVRQRIIRAFLIEEQKIVKRVVAQSKAVKKK